MDELIALNAANLPRLSDTVRVPGYDRTALRAGIVHIGLGNFHRAHQAWYLHRLMEAGRGRDWAILGAGVRPGDATQRERLAAQDWLTTLVELDPVGASAEVIGSMIGFVPVEEGNAALIAAMAEPGIRIVSLTVTEGGYFRDAAGGFDAAHPDIVHDAANPDTPRTAFGAMVAALHQRRAAGAGPFTMLSCDNLQGNGAILRQTILGLAGLIDPDLAGWIGETCTFPNSMVDCIVPATGPKEIALVQAMGIADASPVTHEPFRQWVVEDAFCAGRPALEEVGVTFTDRVHDYEAMKLRILNAGHQLLANAGEVLSLDTVAECMADPDIAAFFGKVIGAEIAPTVNPVPEWTPTAYTGLVKGRFANPSIVDTTRRVAFDGSSRHVGFLHPVLRERIAAGQDYEGLALAEALWARMCAGTREDGSTIEANDPHWPALQAAGRAARTAPAAWISQPLYGEIGQDAGFARAFAHWLTMIWTDGTRASLRRYAGQAG